jgi:ribosomal protein S6
MDKETNVREDARVYEVGYHIVSSVPEEKVAGEVEKIKALITKNGGEFIAEEAPKLRPLAYSMVKVVGSTRSKYNDAYFGWVKFDIKTEGLAAIKTSLDESDAILRYILISTIRENTYLGQKAIPKKEDEVEVKPEEVVAEVEKTEDVVKEA